MLTFLLIAIAGPVGGLVLMAVAKNMIDGWRSYK